MRKHLHSHEKLESLPSLFHELGVDHILVCGDLSTTSHKKEFSKALKLVEEFERKGISVFTVPGNHDQYTRRAFREKIFYNYFGCSELSEKKVAAEELKDGWWLVRLDTAVATSWISSRGLFSLETESHLEETLSSLPKDSKVILMNHFPFFQHDSSRKNLERGSDLRALIQNFPNIKLYVHGHTHRHCIADLRSSGLPIILDSGSVTSGVWNLIDLNKDGMKIQVFGWENSWKYNRKMALKW